MRKFWCNCMKLVSYLLSTCTGILGIFDILQFEISSLNFFSQFELGKNYSLKYQVIKIPFRVHSSKCHFKVNKDRISQISISLNHSIGGISNWSISKIPKIPVYWIKIFSTSLCSSYLSEILDVFDGPFGIVEQSIVGNVKDTYKKVKHLINWVETNIKHRRGHRYDRDIEWSSHG